MRRAGSSPTQSLTAATAFCQSYLTRRCSTRSPSINGVGRTVVAVPGHSHAPGVQQLDAAGARPAERDVDVPGHHSLRLDPCEQLRVTLAWPGQEGLHVRLRRGVAVQRAVDLRRLRKRAQLLHQLVAEHVGGARRDVVDRRRCVVTVHEPAVRVPADPGGVLELLQALDGLLRPGAGGGVVATQHKPVGVLGIRQDRLQGGEVPVDVVEERKQQSARYLPERLTHLQTGTIRMEGLDSEGGLRTYGEQDSTARSSGRTCERHEDQPTWRKTKPRGNQEIHRADLERSTERLEMLLGH